MLQTTKIKLSEYSEVLRREDGRWQEVFFNTHSFSFNELLYLQRTPKHTIMTYTQRFYSRKSIRLREYDYSQQGLYFNVNSM